jgi:hypothetical protein
MRTMKIVGLSLWLVFTFACKKDEDVSACLKLEGTWQGESWKEDGEEFLADTLFITSTEMTFGPLDVDHGTHVWNITYLIGGTEMVIGAYVVNESCNEVTITPKDGAPTTYSFTISGDELKLESNANAVEVELHFRKE